MDYEAIRRNPGEEITCGADMLRIYGYTDTQNPIYGFDMMNNENTHRTMKSFIEKGKKLPDRYNSEVTKLRDYALGGMINEFRSWVDDCIDMYDEEWKEHREHNDPSLPESIYDFWCLYDDILIGKILPTFINLIDPISMTWIDPDYEKVTIDKDFRYQYKLNKPILTSNPTFLREDAEMLYEFYVPEETPYLSIYEELPGMLIEYIPKNILKKEHPKESSNE